VRARVKSNLALTAAVAAAFLACAAPAAQGAPTPVFNALAVTGPTNLPPGVNEAQKVSVDATGGGFTLTFNGQTTVLLAYNEDPSQVAAALNGLSTIGGVGGSVTVSGGPGDAGGTHPYLIAFGGSLASTNVSQLTANSGSLTGGAHTATVTTTVPGGVGAGGIVMYVQNIGGKRASGTITAKIALPAGIVTSGTPHNNNNLGSGTEIPWSCAPTGAGQSLEELRVIRRDVAGGRKSRRGGRSRR